MTKTSAQVTTEFLTKLKNLLAEYNVEIQIEEECRNYHTYSHLNIYAPSVWNKEGDLITESIDIHFGSTIDKDLLIKLT